MRRILIATENSPCSQEAVRHFLETIGGAPAEVFALAVIPPVTGYHTVEQAEAEFATGLLAADQALDDVVLGGAEAGYMVRTLRRLGPPAETIVQVAKELGADLIVLGTHGPGALAPLAGGSVAEAVLHGAPCGVAIFPWRTRVATATV